MRSFLRPALLICLVLLVPIVPFLGFGDALEATIAGWLDPPPSAAVIGMLTVAILASDILLPIPSSLVSTIAGAQLGVVIATLASWLGLTIGAVLGFSLAKTWGRSLARRFSSADDLDRMDQLGRHYGAWVLILTRALPVLAEAAVLLMGTTGLAWRQFLPAVMLSNLGIALVYSEMGHLAKDQGELPLALAASIALPLLAATIARWWIHKGPSNGADERPPAG
jgi:uncharacterized membrane protein YdjX (TVP38/TMEM64 family)